MAKEQRLSPPDLQKALKGMEYPATKEDLVQRAKENKANRTIVDKLEHLKRDRFDGPNEVSKEVFG